MKYEEREYTYTQVHLTLSKEEGIAIRRALYQARMNLLKEGSQSEDVREFERLRDALVKGERDAMGGRGFAT